jgi:hypothetical protein
MAAVAIDAADDINTATATFDIAVFTVSDNATGIFVAGSDCTCNMKVLDSNIIYKPEWSQIFVFVGIYVVQTVKVRYGDGMTGTVEITFKI